VVSDPVGAVLVGADIDADNTAGISTPGQTLIDRIMALVVEAEAVDDGAVGGQPEYPRLVVARLRPGGYRSHFRKAEAQLQERIRHVSILVVSGGHAERIGKIQAGHRAGEPRIGRPPAGGQQAALQRGDRRSMRGFRIEKEEPAAGEIGKAADHAISSGKTCTPSAPSGRGFSQRTAASGSRAYRCG